MDPRIFTAIDLILAVPFGYAAHRVYPNGVGFENTDTAWALGYFGLNMFTCLATTFNSKKIGNFKILVYTYILCTAVTTSLAFYKIDEVACYCTVPYTVWTGFYFLLASYFRHTQQMENKEE
ncbi:hypothetical protein niasHS_008377 [Heterodera schachtii]|uniref:Uncharacterized protein n=1 Tax=Heterodera schachtii TaxID=97005 RepID=A0ABD2J028_HETSC